MKMLRKIKGKAMAVCVLVLVCAIWGGMPVSAAEAPAKPELKDPVQNEDNTSEKEEKKKEETGSEAGDSEEDGKTDDENSADVKEPEEGTGTETEPKEPDAETGSESQEPDAETETESQKPDMETKAESEEPEPEAEIEAEVKEEETVTVDPDQFQTVNLTDGILTDWQQVLEVLRGLTPEMIAGADAGSGVLMLQLKNVESIPAALKDSIASNDSGYAKIVHCGLGPGVSLVLNGASDIGGFHGISNTRVTVSSERRGKKSVATTVRFESHEDIGAVASLQVNLPECSKGTKVSVYAETVAMDEEGNVTVGENACIGTTKAGENGNVEIPIQATANYMFIYKE